MLCGRRSLGPFVIVQLAFSAKGQGPYVIFVQKNMRMSCLLFIYLFLSFFLLSIVKCYDLV